MSRVKIKQKKQKLSVKETLNNNALQEMFHQMMGLKDAPPEVILPKYIDVRSILKTNVYKTLIKMSDLLQNSFPQYGKEIKQIRDFANNMYSYMQLDLEYNDIIGMSIKDIDSEKTDKKFRGLINKEYKKLKEGNKYIKQIFTVCKNLRENKDCIADRTKLDDIFIRRQELYYTPLPFTDLDFKKIWVSDEFKPFIGKYILSVLSHLHEASYNIYDIITSPDINIKDFSGSLIGHITSIKKKIPRCNRAFKIITNSVSMLEDNFTTYYKDSVESKNPQVILESFVSDVARKQKGGASLKREFDAIIKFINKQINNYKVDPRIKTLMELLLKAQNSLNDDMDLPPKNDPKGGKSRNKDESHTTKNTEIDSQDNNNKESDK